MRSLIVLVLMLSLAGCGSQPALRAIEAGETTADVILLGEQHDAPEHQDQHRRVVEALAAHGRLAAVALEMAERGHSTAGLPPTASEAQVRDALHWTEAGWPWSPYAPAVMAAVRSGVPVLGANLPREQWRAAMSDSALDALLAPPAIQAQQQAIRLGHCGLLPESQINPMTRVQIARDRAMAQTLAQAAAPGKAVVLIAGGGHVDPELGVPQHLPTHLRVQALALPAQPQKKDYCAGLREQLKPEGAK